MSADAVDRILGQLRDVAGVDFTAYKRAAIERRLERQVALRRLESLDEYAQWLAARPAEVHALYEDLLVHVTEFFREPEAIEAFVATALPEILEARRDEAPIRAWVAGCSTGEEVYSLAIAVLDALRARSDPRGIQFFGTDLSERAIALARGGRYPDAVAAQIGDDRVGRYFTRDPKGWRVATRLRESCVFVQHDLTIDPPFSRLDLVSCRNVLIYLGASLQQRVVPMLHYALDQPGYLLIGGADSIAEYAALFEQVSPGLPLFRRRPGAGTRGPFHRVVGAGRRPELRPSTNDLFREADHALLARYAPACVLVDDNFEILQFRGRTGAFLEAAPGVPQTNVLKMAREEVASELRRIARQAQRDQVATRASGLVVGRGDQSRRVDLEVIPLRSIADASRHYLLTFRETGPVASPQPERKRAVARGTSDRVEQLEQELIATREYLTSVIAQHLATAEELGLVNEELQSANEEIQASNEELSAAKEELVSSNDELESLNAELERGNATLRGMNDDLVNVLASVEVAIVIVDTEGRIRRFTPAARALFNLIDTDVGRPISNLQPSIEVRDLTAVLARVIATLEPVEREVQEAGASWFRMQVRPYRSSSGAVGGAVISLVDITQLRQSIEAGRRAREAEQLALDAARREKEAFLNAVSHELRTPLNAIVLWTEVLHGVASEQPELAPALAEIKRGAHAEAQLVDDLLDLALAQTNASALAVAPVMLDPAPVVSEAIESLRAQAEDKQLIMGVALEPDLRIEADPRRLRQIVWHLVTNAIKFTPAGGRVEVVLARGDGCVEVRVRDTGEGIRAELADRVFEPFSREDFSASRTHEGLGIGLALVRHLVQRHGGTIQMASDGEARGSTFVVQLPAR